MPPELTGRGAWSSLRRFVNTTAPDERCEICGTGLGQRHTHLFEPASRQLVCVCDACAVSAGEQAGTPYRRVPHRVRALSDFRLDDSGWDALLIPVGMAFFFYNTPAGRVLALYPSPAGATESQLSLEAWQEIVRENPVLDAMEPDVEALLVNRLGAAREYYLVPIDTCYELVGLLRANWCGLAGGAEVWQAIREFYAGLQERATRLDEGAHA